MGVKKKQDGGSVASKRVQELQNFIDSDSDSYGSEGGLKPKPEVIKKRGGKKRNKNGEMADEKSGAYQEANENSQEEANFNGADEEEVTAEIMKPETNVETTSPGKEDAIIVDWDNNLNQNLEEIKIIEAPSKKSGNYKPLKKRKDSPPMIQEYDPTQDNAKTRAKKRAEEIKKKQDTWEIDKNQYPEHPAPWKGKPSDFFLLHEPRNGSTKVLNNSQKEFIYAYYPDNVIDEVSFMELLYKQAKDHEDQERWAKEQNEREAAIIRGRTKKGRKRNRAPQYVQEIAHTNKDRPMTIDNKPMSFESLLENEPINSGPDYHSLTGLRNQINLIQTTTLTNYAQKYKLEQQHTIQAAPNIGFCAHCHQHTTSYLGSTTGTVNDDYDIQRQSILMQICEAKKRQARMEVEEARRLKDEARRLAEQASLLELEAQRPLLEAQRLEQEARVIEAQMARIPHHVLSSKQSSANSSAISMEALKLQHDYRATVNLRKQQLMEESRHTQNEIRRLQEQALKLQTQVQNPKLQMHPQEDLSSLYAALAQSTNKPKVVAEPLFVPSKNSIAARAATQSQKPQQKLSPRQPIVVQIDPELQAQIPKAKKPVEPPKAMVVAPEPKKKVIQPQYDDYGDESDSQAAARTDDPLMSAATKEFEKAKKLFEQAQKSKEDAERKQEERIRKQQEEIEKAQLQTRKYFEEEKKRQEEEDSLKKPKDLKENQKQAQFNHKCDSLLSSFNTYIQKLGREKQAFVYRYSNRNQVQEYLEPILSGKILKDFDTSNGYINFAQYNLEDNFVGGHQEYLHKWRNLFLYETYCYLMNSRWSKFTGTEIELRNLMKQQQSERAMCWKGYVQYASTEGKLATLKLFKEPPNVYNYTSKGKNFSKIYEEPDRHEGENFDLTHCREDDLLVISKMRINLEGQDDIKMVTGGVKFLKEVLSKNGVMLGYVNRANTKTDNFVEIQIDAKLVKQFQVSENDESQSNIFTRYFYFFESILTNLREYKALKTIEFTRLSPMIAYPTLTLDYNQQMIMQYTRAVDSCFNQMDSGPEMNPKEFELNDEQQQSQMNNYLIQNHGKFNKSQATVLEQIIEMPKDQIMLIQGPPGTGKTHTIIGIISMIMSTKLAKSKQKIMVCAPSNAAVDQIINRIIERGLIGLKSLKEAQRKEKQDKDLSDDSEDYELPDLSQNLIRISGAEYQTETGIKKYSLEQRIIKKLAIEKFGDLKHCIKELKDMISSMNNYDDWDDNQDFPYVSKVKYQTYSKKLMGSSIRKAQNWGNIKLSRQQQLQVMEDQLKLHNNELNEFKQGSNIYQGNSEWKEAEKAIIQEANIVCCTLSMAGSAKLEPFRDRFEYLIIDEACQSTEPSTLIPFQHAPKRVILVGDQKQLPATTFSGNSEQTGYCKSLFERLLDAGFDKTMLTIQFRMHPKIRAFPSEQFYGGAITDHPSIGSRHPPQQIQNLTNVFPSRIIFFDIQETEEIFDNKSKCNYDEADFTRLLVDFIARKSTLQGTLKYMQDQIGVISPYKAQVRQLVQRLEKLCSDQGVHITNTLEVNTVDAFQGSEKDIIIFNCVRSNSETQIEKSLGFLLDERRLNVAITRPKHFLIVIGNVKTLKKSDVWDNMINYCRIQGKLIEVKGRYMYESMAAFKQHVLSQFDEFD